MLASIPSLLTLTSLIPWLGQHSGAEDEEDSQGQQQGETTHILLGAGAGDMELEIWSWSWRYVTGAGAVDYQLWVWRAGLTLSVIGNSRHLILASGNIRSS